jgi:membrane-associated PAP2 superfamily phosphatase
VLKDMTGVYCPVSTTFFGGTHPILAPHFGFSLSAPGNCWPGGFAGTGFSLIPFWFAFRRRRPPLARAGLFFAILFGTVCGVIQMMRGYHFPSHNVATFLLDWSLSALVYLAFLASSLKRSHAARFIRIPQKA